MILNDLADSFCHSQKNAGLKGLNVYRAPSGSIDTFVDELSIVIDKLLDSDRRLLLLGDFNCPMVRQAPVWMID